MLSIEKQLCEAAAERLVRLLESDTLAIMDTVALEDQELLRLSKLTLSQQRYLIRHADELLSITIEARGLRRRLKELESINALREIEDRFLSMGAPHVLMRRLFGMHASEFSGRRQLLNLGGTATGRPKACSEQTEHLIWHQWRKHSDLDERDRFIAVVQTTGEDLHTIWHALRDHIDR